MTSISLQRLSNTIALMQFALKETQLFRAVQHDVVAEASSDADARKGRNCQTSQMEFQLRHMIPLEAQLEFSSPLRLAYRHKVVGLVASLRTNGRSSFSPYFITKQTPFSTSGNISVGYTSILRHHPEAYRHCRQHHHPSPDRTASCGDPGTLVYIHPSLLPSPVSSTGKLENLNLMSSSISNVADLFHTSGVLAGSSFSYKESSGSEDKAIQHFSVLDPQH
jgi:hypothetical protein